MIFCSYILHSPSLDKYYVGSTHDLESRLAKHISGYYDKSFSRRASDWELFLTIKCDDESHARRVEMHIKRMKSRAYYQSLKSIAGLAEKLAERYREKRTR